jgi:hypothetical protein
LIADPRNLFAREKGESQAQGWMRVYLAYIKAVLAKKVSAQDGGHMYSNQYALFFDKRTGMTSAQAVPVEHSGFEATHEIRIISDTNITHSVSKIPQTLSVEVGGVPAIVEPGVITSESEVDSTITPDLEVYM